MTILERSANRLVALTRACVFVPCCRHRVKLRDKLHITIQIIIITGSTGRTLEASHWEKLIEGGGRNGGCNVKASTTNDKNKRKSFTSLCLFYLRMWTKATCYRDAHMDSMCMHTHNGVQLMKRIKCQTNSLTLLWSSPINTNIPEDIKATKRRLASLIMHCVVAKEPPRSGRWAIKSLDLRCS